MERIAKGILSLWVVGFTAFETAAVEPAEKLVTAAATPTQRQATVDAVVEQSLKQHVAEMMGGLSDSARRGYEFLTTKPYLPHDFDETIVDALAGQKGASPVESLARYGVSERPDLPGEPLQYVHTGDRFIMNCFACHGGDTYGVSFPGAPNTHYALEALTADVRHEKLQRSLPLAHMDIGSMFMPLGTSVGTSNAVMFGVALMSHRDADLNVLPLTPPPPMIHHDMDAPPWWHFSRKTHMYIDGFADKGSKGLMQFMLVRQNGPEQFRSWATDFEDVYQFLSEVKPPKYPLAIDAAAAERGRGVFTENCAHCHGGYGQQATYPEVNVPIDEIGTDRVRFDALTIGHRQAYGASWFADYGQQDTIASPAGYTAPPLDGIWASAPYLHNGSVPTLRGVLFPEQRPAIWRRSTASFNERDVGLIYDAVASDDLKQGDSDPLSAWRTFDTRRLGKSHAGHLYPASLSTSEREDLLEYLKTL